MSVEDNSLSNRVRSLLTETIEEINLQLPPAERLVPDLDADLVGPSGQMDSLAFIHFVVSAEERLQKEFGRHIPLADQSTSLDAADMFKNLRTLSERLAQALSGP